MSNVFAAVYTNKVKRYCDDKFFAMLTANVHSNHLHIVDNSSDGGEYCERLRGLGLNAEHLDISDQPETTKFHRKVAESVTYLRDKFLQSSYEYFFIAESDVIMPHDKTVATLINNIQSLPSNTGAVGALYYEGFHDYKLTGLQQIDHVLSGCTVYTREMIAKYPFRWQADFLQAFPDALICIDAINEFTYYNNHDLKCHHAHAADGSRYV
jgi:hypothetical protein